MIRTIAQEHHAFSGVTDFAHRLDVLLNESKMTSSELARRVGMSETIIRKYRSADSEPTRPALIALAKTLEVNLLWLACGEGPKVGDKPLENVGDGEYVSIPYLSESMMSAAQSRRHEESRRKAKGMQFERTFLREYLGADVNSLFMICMEGDSMEPTIRNFNTLIVHVQTEAFSREGIYVLKSSDTVYIRRLRRKWPNDVQMISDNPHYGVDSDIPADALVPFGHGVQAAADKCLILGRVVHLEHRL